ncbi:MAG: nucleotide exchange factor GrpE [Clostridiales bacterium]|nr:nucleotide exchange factor GrpE [Clostridiales bacterium]MCI1962126.1 nucleotide exchange factor GrpE [Clostridiales bacterium]MCI2022568.1 nucleotide exchange factor GrpE [Clostridiales bacterium]MCI2027117.1 nucleotide exchange factor GrpE [Clostridiales bacterium]MCI2161937.1 nucleotide exchange factor GrpE [Oscillospiraceae bacterium]
MNKKEDNQEKQKEKPQEEKAEEANVEEKEPAETKPEAKAENPQEDPAKLLEKAQAELKKQKDILLRTAAEYDNYRKRTEREKTTAYADATAATVLEFLPVADNLTRALSQKDCSIEDLRKGIEMVQKQMESALKKLGVEPMGKKGDPFDAEYHNAVSHIESDDLGENVIAEVFQPGYKLGNRIVRHAMVQVAN